MVKIERELFVVLSNRCNMQCAHCVTSSGPKPKNPFHITSEEIERIARFVEKTPQIKRIHFSGGEPTIHLDEIRQFQNRLPNLSYAMTSNGWFGRRAAEIFDQIKLDVVLFSYDKYHKPYIDPAVFQQCLRTAVARGIRTFLKLTISDPSDLSLLPEVAVEGANLHINSLVQVGRAAEKGLTSDMPSDLEFWEKSCPSLEEERIDNLERVVYYPGKGLTPCCGPMTSLNSDFVFSRLEDDYDSTNSFYQQLSAGNFLCQKPKDLNVHDVSAKSACDVCAAIYCKRSKAAGL